MIQQPFQVRCDEDWYIDNSLWDYTISPPQCIHEHKVLMWGIPADLPDGYFDFISPYGIEKMNFWEAHLMRRCNVERGVLKDDQIIIRKSARC